MKEQTFHWEIRTIIAQFEDAFSDIVINRHNINKDPEDQIAVNLVYAPKSRVLYDLVDKAQHIKLPCVAVSPGGLRRDVERVFNKIDGSYHTNSPVNSAWVHLLQPVPVKLTMNMSIIARFQQDIDQILTNFIPYTDPYVVVSWKWPDIIPWADFEIRSHIMWNESVTFQYPVDITNDVHYRIIADTSFDIETWMFKNSPNIQGPIYEIDHSFTSVSAIDDFRIMKDYESLFNTEVFLVSAKPTLVNIWPYLMYHTPSSFEETGFVVQGNMLDYTDYLFASGNPGVFDMTWIPSAVSANPFYHNYFDNISSLSAFYPPFSGVMIPSGDWHIDSQNQISFTLSALGSGYFDVIALNAAGYGKLTEGSIKYTPNPYPLSSTAWYAYQPIQPPYISGVNVLFV